MNRLRLVAALVVLAALLPGARVLRVSAMEHYLGTRTYEDVYYMPPPAWMQVFSLGHDEALADLVWLRALVYFGDELVHRGQVRHVFEYTDVMLTLDPDFRAVYRWAGTAGMYRPTEVTVDDMRRSIAYLERGARRFPNDGEMMWDAGASLCFELTPWIEDEEEKRAVNLRGTAYLEAAARLGAGPDWLVFTNATQLRRLGQTERAIEHLEEMYATLQDEELRANVAAQLATLRGARYAEAFRALYEQLEEQRLATFPYVPPELHIFLGPRPPTDPDVGLFDEPSLDVELEP